MQWAVLVQVPQAEKVPHGAMLPPPPPVLLLRQVPLWHWLLQQSELEVQEAPSPRHAGASVRQVPASHTSVALHELPEQHGWPTAPHAGASSQSPPGLQLSPEPQGGSAAQHAAPRMPQPPPDPGGPASPVNDSWAHTPETRQVSAPWQAGPSPQQSCPSAPHWLGSQTSTAGLHIRPSLQNPPQQGCPVVPQSPLAPDAPPSVPGAKRTPASAPPVPCAQPSKSTATSTRVNDTRRSHSYPSCNPGCRGSAAPRAGSGRCR